MKNDTDYNRLEKCYSIWVCRDNVPKKEQFSVSFIEMNNTENYGNCQPRKENYDLLTLVIIRLGNEVFPEMKWEDTNKNNMLEFLHTILYPHQTGFLNTVKKYIDFSENEDLWKEIDNMSGLGQSILEQGIEQELEQGTTNIRLLTRELAKDGRENELFAALEDPELMKQLLHEFKIIAEYR